MTSTQQRIDQRLVHEALERVAAHVSGEDRARFAAASLPAVSLERHGDLRRWFELFESIADRPWAVFLDSGRPLCGQGRYDRPPV